MPSTTIDPEILAQRLESVAEHYEQLAHKAGSYQRLVSQLRAQAAESREWATAFRNIACVTFDGDGNLEIDHA